MELELSRLIDALPGLVWIALPDGRAEFLNGRWCEYTGISLADNIEADGVLTPFRHGRLAV